MDDASIDFLKELGRYDSSFWRICDERGVERVREDIIQERERLASEEPARVHEWQYAVTDIAQAKNKIAEQAEEIKKYIAQQGISNEEYEEIAAVSDPIRRRELLEEFVVKRAHRVKGELLSAENVDKVVHHFTTEDEMSEMRKSIILDRRNILESLALLFIDSMELHDVFMHALGIDAAVRGDEYASEKQGSAADAFEKALKRGVRAFSRIEQYQKDGLSALRHLQELDRQLVYMLKTLELKKSKK